MQPTLFIRILNNLFRLIGHIAADYPIAIILVCFLIKFFGSFDSLLTGSGHLNSPPKVFPSKTVAWLQKIKIIPFKNNLMKII